MSRPSVALKDHWQEQRLFLSRVIGAAVGRRRPPRSACRVRTRQFADADVTERQRAGVVALHVGIKC